jgi:hypothetical protein
MKPWLCCVVVSACRILGWIRAGWGEFQAPAGTLLKYFSLRDTAKYHLGADLNQGYSGAHPYGGIDDHSHYQDI